VDYLWIRLNIEKNMLPAIPSDWNTDSQYVVHNPLSGFPLKVKVEVAGQHFQIFEHRRLGQRTVSEQERFEEANSIAKDEEEELSDDEEESPELLRSDPKDWKNQDHYAVLGLSKLRLKATEEDLKKAFRKKVLKHHPDKKAATGGSANDDAFFKCVQKAFEVLTDPFQRMCFDSVDPTFNSSIPSEKDITQKNFFKVLGPIFESNARFSKKQPVPKLGDENSSAQQIDHFYNFWYNFDSWRIFNYLDEEDPMTGESREDKRHIEKKNKKAREERKKEDNARIRELTDLAAKLDPRMKKLKDLEKEKKEAEKKAKERAKEKEELLQKKKEEEERLKKAKAEEIAKAKADEEKKEKEAKKNALRNFRKNIRKVVKDANYFLSDHLGPESREVLDGMIQMEKVCESSTYEDLSRLSELALAFESNPEAFEAAYRAELGKFFDEKQLPPVLEKKPKEETQREWTDPEQILLIHAVKTFPGGTTGRWDKIAAYVNEHSKMPPRTAKEVTHQVNQMKHALEEGKIGELETNKIVKKHNDTVIADSPTQRLDDGPDSKGKEKGKEKEKPKEAKETNGTKETKEKKEPKEKEKEPEKSKTETSAEPNSNHEEESKWSKEEQAALEKALKTFDANEETRWDKIASAVGTKSKKECMLRCKKIAQQIKDKKANKS